MDDRGKIIRILELFQNIEIKGDRVITEDRRFHFNSGGELVQIDHFPTGKAKASRKWPVLAIP